MSDNNRGEKPVVYTVIPKYLVFGNLTIGTYVENHGYAANTPWQYSYGMGGRVDYEGLKESLNTLAIRSDELWVFAEREGFVPSLEVETHFGLGITDGCCREISLFEEEHGRTLAGGESLRYFHFDAEELEIDPVHPPFRPEVPDNRAPSRPQTCEEGGLSNGGAELTQVPDSSDVLFWCPNCDWVGPAEDVEWGRWTPPGQDAFYESPDKSDCPECGELVEAHSGGIEDG